MMTRLPDFVVIGAMKCGTSSLHEQLARRPGIFMSNPKEPNFFSDDDRYQRGMNEYTALFGAALPDQICGESSTHYTKLPTYPRTVERMRKHLGGARLVYLMRDPVDRIVSQYIHEWTQNEVRGSLEQVVRQHERFVAYSSYARQLEPFLSAYGSSRILLVFLERLVQFPNEELARICSFLGDPSPGIPAWQPEAPQNVSRERLRRSRLRESLLGVPIFRSIKDRLPGPARDKIKAFWQMRRRPDLSAALRTELEARLDPDLARLGDWLGRRLTCSRWREVASGPVAEWKID